MIIEFANESHVTYLKEKDRHLPEQFIESKITREEIIVLKNEMNQVVGWLRFNFFWDNCPFMNMLYIEEDYRSKGLGQKMVFFWENEMKQNGYSLVMTSTLSNEEAQFFYRKLGYKDSGSLLLEGEALEIIFTKVI